MKLLSLILSILALSIAGIALYQVHTASATQPAVTGSRNAGSGNFRIAYFDIDSLQNNYNFYKDALEGIKSRESAANTELQELKVRFQRRVQQLQEKGPAMSQAEQAAAQQELAKMEQDYKKREAQLQELLQTQQMDQTRNMRRQIEDFLTEYNKEKGYSYVFSYEPGFFMYYKDSTSNITADLIKGLNERHPKKTK